MNRSFRGLLAPIGALLAGTVLLACSSTPAASTAPTAAATSAATAAATTAATATAAATTAASSTAAAATTIKTATVGTTLALVDAKGLTLYQFKNDTAGSGKSACAGGCATTWPALSATGAPSKAAGIAGDLGTITRDDGTTQVTYKGQPLYRFAADTAAGDAKGAAINNWSVAIP